MDIERALCQWIRQERQRREWTQEELSDRLTDAGMHIGPTGVTRLEAGERTLRLNAVPVIAAVFGVDVDVPLGVALDRARGDVPRPMGPVETLHSTALALADVQRMVLAALREVK